MIKEGLYEDFENRDAIQKIVRFYSTTGNDDLVSLDDYVGRMKKGQDAIYYISGEELDAVRRSPQLEGLPRRGIEVLLLTDAVDEFWIQLLEFTRGNHSNQLPEQAQTSTKLKPILKRTL